MKEISTCSAPPPPSAGCIFWGHAECLGQSEILEYEYFFMSILSIACSLQINSKHSSRRGKRWDRGSSYGKDMV